MPCCAVISCKNKSGSHNLSRGGISYHRFPSDPETKAKWILSTGRQNWIPGKTATICSIHFEPHYFVTKEGGRHYLHPVAVPTQNTFSLRFGSSNGMISVDGTENSQFGSSNAMISVDGTENSRVNSIEVEITPENSVILKSQTPEYLSDSDTNKSSRQRTHEEDKRLIELLRTKLKDQDLLIKKLKMRNCRLKRRLFSLKSMES